MLEQARDPGDQIRNLGLGRERVDPLTSRTLSAPSKLGFQRFYSSKFLHPRKDEGPLTRNLGSHPVPEAEVRKKLFHVLLRCSIGVGE